MRDLDFKCTEFDTKQILEDLFPNLLEAGIWPRLSTGIICVHKNDGNRPHFVYSWNLVAETYPLFSFFNPVVAKVQKFPDSNRITGVYYDKRIEKPFKERIHDFADQFSIPKVEILYLAVN